MSNASDERQGAEQTAAREKLQKKRHAVLFWSGCGAVAAGIGCALLLPLLTHSTAGHFAALLLFLLLFTAGVDLCMLGAMLRIDGASASKKRRLSRLLIPLGFSLAMVAVICFFAVSLTTTMLLGGILGGILFLGGIGLVIVGCRLRAHADDGPSEPTLP